MGLLETEIQRICLEASRKRFGENSHYEHLHTSFLHEESIGLVQGNNKVHLVQFTFMDNALHEQNTLHEFAEDLSTMKPLFNKLIQMGREFGNKEAIK